MPRTIPVSLALLILVAGPVMAGAETGALSTLDTPSEDVPVEDVPEEVLEAQEVPWSPPSAGKDGFTWIQLISEEWVKGEITDLRDGTLSFDSDEMDEFDYDWADVRAVISSQPHTVTTWQREVYTGFIVARGANIRILDEDGAEIASVDPDDVSSMIEGYPSERNFWSGKFSFGSTVRSGNSDQSDFETLIKLDRRALVTRWSTTANSSAASSGGEKTQETQRYSSRFDYFMNRNYFVTIAGYEFFRDPFQNFGQRHTAGSAVGYDSYLLGADWDASVGAVWQYVEFESVEAGEDRTTDVWAARVSTRLEWDITSDVEFDLSYGINVPFDDANSYTSNLLSTLSVDLWWNFELDLTFAWDRQNNPRADEDGNLPEKDDYRLTTGIGWDF